MTISHIIIVAFLGLVLSAIAKRVEFSSELFLVLIMGGASFIPFVPRIIIDGHHLLEIILPPLLFSAARNLSGYKFRKMRNPILWMGFGLIFFTAIIVAFVADAVTGFMTFSSGLILGAVVAPPDAVSSISIGKKLHLPDRVMTILTGESLINDAAALTLFVFAIGIYYGENGFIEHPVALLAYTSLVGIGIGIGAGILTILVRKLLRDANIVAVFTGLVPWALYIWAETIHASGVLAVVVAGFIIERTTFQVEHVTRLAEQSLWRSIETLLDAFVFAYIGLQLRFIIQDLAESTLDTTVTLLSGFLILLVVIAVRPVGVLGYNTARLIWYHTQYKHIKHFVPTNYGNKIESRASQKLRNAGVSWREFLILSWTGMRGVVTLAAAAAVPMKFATEDTVNYTSDGFKVHIYVQVVGLIVAFGTLLLQGLTLPFVIRKLMSSELMRNASDSRDGHWNKARTIMEDAALEVIETEAEIDPDNFDKEHFIKIWKELDTITVNKTKHDISFMSSLLTEIVEKQRADIGLAARTGELHPDVAREFLNKLDLRLASFTTR